MAMTPHNGIAVFTADPLAADRPLFLIVSGVKVGVKRKDGADVDMRKILI
jgi:hypothetical protein